MPRRLAGGGGRAVAVGAGRGLGWLLLGVVAVRWQRVRSRPVRDAALRELVDVLRAELGCRRPVEVRQSDDLVTAATIGWRSAGAPAAGRLDRWTGRQRRAVLAHEIAHVRRHDFLALLFGQLGLVLHFYHPLLHWLMNRSAPGAGVGRRRRGGRASPAGSGNT